MSTPAAERSCAGCTLCCKLLGIAELAKPAAQWCAHCAVGEGCKIYETRPAECRSFNCAWLLDASLGPEWAPKRCRFMIARDQNRIVIHVDPAQPDAWRKPPFRETINNWGAALTPRGAQVLVVENGDVTMILPGGEKRLGQVGDDQMILAVRRDRPQGPLFDAIVVAKDDPRALRAMKGES